MVRRIVAVVALAAAVGGCRNGTPPPRTALGISVPYEIHTLDPHVENGVRAFSVVFNLYEPLVTTDADLALQPCLARSWESRDPDTWIFHLRPGVRFHDGKPLTSRDVVATFRRLIANPSLEVSGYLAFVSGVRAVDPLTVEIRTSRPDGALPAQLRLVAIVPEAWAQSPRPGPPDGTGPYRFVSQDARGAIHLARNDHYWGPKPKFASAVILTERTPEQVAADLRAGRAQLGELTESAAAPLPPSRFRILREASIFVQYLGFDFRGTDGKGAAVPGDPFLDARVRRAVQLAIRPQRFSRTLPSAVIPVGQLVPPSIFGYNASIAAPVPDPMQARRLLAEAGYPHGFSAVLTTRRILADAARSVAADLGAVGIHLSVRAMSDGDFFRLADAHEAGFYLAGIGCMTGDISDLLDNCIHSSDPARRFGIHNYGAFSDPDVDRAIESSAAVASPARRRDALQRLSAQLMERLVWVPLFVPEQVYAAGSGIRWRPRADNMVLAGDVSPGGGA